MVVEKNLKQKDETTDNEQNEKYLETVELLLAAGYFRARIKGLSPFDKVVGGMTWCISTCDFDIDVDLLFQENSTIGQKIALTEKIVAVLPSMKCPHRIEPHQIQGLDFIHIFPVIQWLVKRAIETRQEQGDKIRAYSITQFNKNHVLPQDIEIASKQEVCILAVKTFKETYKPKRVYKKPAAYCECDEETQVHSTLLEYGKKYSFIKVGKDETESSVKQKTIASGLTRVSESSEDDTEKEEKRIQSLMEGMSEADIQHMLSSRIVGSIVGLKSDEISDIAQHYAQRQEILEQETTELKVGKGGAFQVHKRQVTAISNAVHSEKGKLEEVKVEVGRVKNEFEKSKEIYDQQVILKERLGEEVKKLEEMENEHTSNTLSKLQALVTLNENLKKQEQDFKAQCKLEKKELDEKIEALNQDISSNSHVEMEQIKMIDEQLANDNKKLRQIRLLMAKKNREIASLQWKIDDVPYRSELAQYQRRFIELYNQVASTHKETKQFYSFYNTLDDKKLQLEKEVGILNSIHDGFGQAYSQSVDSKNEFLEQLEKITLGVKQNEARGDKKKQMEKEKRGNLNEKSIELNEKQRLYFKTIREFQEECKKSEIIQSKLCASGEQR